MSTKNALLFVCTGNTCRSPAAAKILAGCLARHAHNPRGWVIDSAGLRAGRGQAASQGMTAVLARKGLDLSRHLSRPVEDLKMDLYALVLVMERSQQQDMLARFPGLSGRIFLLSEMSGGQDEVEDPYGADDQVYEQTALQIEMMIEGGLSRIIELAAE